MGHVAVRSDTKQVALVFVLEENDALRCTLRLAESPPAGGLL